jgi:hypothetical protein
MHLYHSEAFLPQFRWQISSSLLPQPLTLVTFVRLLRNSPTHLLGVFRIVYHVEIILVHTGLCASFAALFDFGAEVSLKLYKDAGQIDGMSFQTKTPVLQY